MKLTLITTNKQDFIANCTYTFVTEQLIVTFHICIKRF